MKAGDKVRVKRLEEVLKIEGIEDYNDVGDPGITNHMLECFGNDGLIKACSEYGDCMVLFDEGTWVFKKEWLDPVSVVRVEEIKNPTYDDLKPLFIKTDSDRHVEGVMKMRKSEFIKRVKELGYDTLDIDVYTKIYSNSRVVAIVHNDRVNSLDTDYYEIVPNELFDVLVEYARTPIEESKDVKE